MTKPTEASRWSSRPAGGDQAEDCFAELLRAGAPTEGLGAAARDRVWSRLASNEGAEGRARLVPSLWRLRWGVVVGVLLTSSVVVGGVSARRWWPALKALRADHAAEGQAAPARTRALAERRSPAAVTAAEPAPVTEETYVPALVPARGADVVLADAPAVETSAPPNVRRAARREADEASVAPEPEAPPALPVEATPSALANETALLGVALAHLRQQQDAQGALAALDTYDARMPHGTLRREADAARVDALLMLGRDADALALLQTLPLQPRGRDQELRVVRGELAAPTSCPRAVADFDAVLASAPASALAERALHGRATCLARLGDTAAARRDLAEYLRRYPDGRFAAEARRTLGDRTGGGDL